MKFFLVTGILILLISYCLPAQNILLKRKFISYQFSTDSVNYQGIGGRAFRLRKIMENEEECVSLLDKYSSLHTFSIATGICGGLLVVYPVAVYLTGSNEEWQDDLTAVAVTGAVFVAAAVVFDVIAGNNLRKAVGKYNSLRSGIPGDIGQGLRINSHFTGIKLSINYPF